MSIEEAREALRSAAIDDDGYVGRRVLPAIEALIDAKLILFHAELARLSPAPVGGETPPCPPNMDPVKWNRAMMAEAPTPPPAEPDGGEAEMHALKTAIFGRENYDRGLKLKHFAQMARITEESRKSALLREADLKQRLAATTLSLEATKAFLHGEEMNSQEWAGWARDTERDLAEARKRNADLEAGLGLAANRLDLLGVNLIPGSRSYIEAGEWVIEARALLTPATDKGA